MESATRGAELLAEAVEPETWRLQLSGAWTLSAGLPTAESAFDGPDDRVRRITFEAASVTGWDSGLLAFALKVVRLGEARGLEVDRSGLPEGVQKLVDLALAVPEVESSSGPEARSSLLHWVGTQTLDLISGFRDAFTFTGELTLSMLRLVRGRAQFRGADLVATVQDVGVRALGIVSLISFLVGLILAYIGAVQFQMFGAEIYVANLVGIAMAREMAAIMTGIIMAGRTGAAFAAQLGTMTVNEEIDSLRTFGFSPIDFLVLPRALALVLMMPILTIYANLLGILGGLLVGTTFGIEPGRYWNQTLESVSLTDFMVGIAKGGVFGVLVAVAGCMRGMRSGRSASAVGEATTSAVVLAIVLIIVTDAVFAVLLATLEI
jgi:phospholipid/cholesterol/gamma-HCH transport system permease protein